MHSRGYYRKPDGGFNHHAMKMAGKNHDMTKINMRRLSVVNDGKANYDFYTMDVESTLGVSVNGLDTNRKNTKLALRQPLSIVPIDNIARAIAEKKFSLVPVENTLPTPVKPKEIVLLAA